MNIKTTLDMWKKILIIFGIALWSCSGKVDDNIDALLADHFRAEPLITDHERLQYDIYIPDEISRKYDMEQRIDIYNAWSETSGIGFDKLEDSVKYNLVIPHNLNIADIFTEEPVDNVYDRHDAIDRGKTALYVVLAFNKIRNLMLYHNGEYKFFLADKGYEKNVMDIFEYFNKCENIDKRLLPLCIQEITKLYVSNMLLFSEYRPWRQWLGDDADSLGRIYNKYLRYK